MVGEGGGRGRRLVLQDGQMSGAVGRWGGRRLARGRV